VGCKDGLCVKLTTYHHPVLLSRNLGNLTSWNHLGPPRACNGTAFLLLQSSVRMLHSPPILRFFLTTLQLLATVYRVSYGKNCHSFKLTDLFLKPTKITKHAYLAIFLRRSHKYVCIYIIVLYCIFRKYI